MGFAADTAVGSDGACTISDRWQVPVGPNGGYIAAVALRGMLQAVGDPGRFARSLTCHYLSPLQPGPAVVQTTVEREGRSLTTVSARLVQDGRPCVLALGAFSRAFDSPATWEVAPPGDVPGPDEVEPSEPHPKAPTFARRIEARNVGAAPFSGAAEARVGGWMRLRDDDAPLDAPLIALLADAWMPAAFARLSSPAAAPTVDLTVHFRAPLPLDAGDGHRVLGIFTSRHAQHGFFEEDGELFSEDGRLIAMSRQLAVLR